MNLLALYYYYYYYYIIIIIIIIIHLTLTEVKILTIKNIYLAVAIPLNDKDGMLIKVNGKNTKKNKIQWLGE